MDFSTDVQASVLAILPEILMTALAIALLGLDLIWPQARKRDLGYVAGGGLLAIAAVMLVLGQPQDALQDQLVLGGMIRHDQLAQIFRTMVMLGGALSSLVAMGVPRLQDRGDFYAVLVASVTGASLMSAAADLIMAFLALEMTSITAYLLVGYLRGDVRSSEAGLKYFLFGAFTSALSLYGLSLLYGFTGETNLYRLGGALGRGDLADGAVVVALGLVTVGFAFKISAVPFHFWTPDVYEGAPTPITTLLSTASKAGSMALLMRFFLAVFPPADLLGALDGVRDFSAYWVQLVAVLAVVSMVLGNVLALVQTNIKRLLAYSTIAHAGYILIALAAAGTAGLEDEAAQAVIIYLLAYAFTNVGAFAVIATIERDDATNTSLDALRGLAARRPWLAAAMAVFMLSLTGIPLTAGFIGKWYVFKVALQADLIAAAVVGVLTSAVSAYYYLRVVWMMYFEEGAGEASTPPALAWGIGIAAVGTLLLGALPYILSDMAREITLAFGG